MFRSLIKTVKNIDKWPKVERYVNTKIKSVSQGFFGTQPLFADRSFQFAGIGASSMMRDQESDEPNAFSSQFFSVQDETPSTWSFMGANRPSNKA